MKQKRVLIIISVFLLAALLLGIGAAYSFNAAPKTAANNISTAAVTLERDEFGYVGRAIRPAVKSVKLGSETLTENTDYTVSYSNNKKVGTGTVIITGKGRYQGETRKNFKILKNGWVYENGYKLYYQKGKLRTDLRNILKGDQTYYIKTNVRKDVVTVYAKDGDNGFIIPVVNFICSAGTLKTEEELKTTRSKAHYRTPTGTFRLISKKRWQYFKTWDEYVQYAVKWKGTVYFHSLAYDAKNDPYSLHKQEYDDLGTNASHGCIRLLAEDAKWIYDNFDNIEKCKFVESKDIGPYPKPEKPAIGKNNKGYYDPTDPLIR